MQCSAKLECFYGRNCALLGHLTFPDEDIIKYYNKPFLFIFMKTAEEKTEEDLEGFHQCVYRLKYFHDCNCVLKFSEISYY